MAKESGRPLPQARVTVTGVPGVVETDNEGKFRTPGLVPGVYSVTVRLIGYRPKRADSLRVESGKTTPLSFILETAAVELPEVVVTSQEVSRATNAANLLALQQAAPAASDGLSQDLIQKAPDSDAGGAVARISGVSVVDNKFLVVRGLSERYNSTLLNGAEVASPEPLKRVVPLNIFASNLLESLVATKSGTPDRPGDFAGASLDIKTRDFPDAFTFSARISQEYNDQTTFKPTLIGPRSISDFFTMGGSSRAVTAPYPTNNTPPGTAADYVRSQTFGQAIRPLWSPTPRNPAPNLGLGINVGGQAALGRQSRLGYVASVTYSNDVQASRNQFLGIGGAGGNYAVSSTSNSGVTSVDVGAIANFALQLDPSNKVAWKNFFTRATEETFAQALVERPALNEGQALVNEFGVRYIERQTLQTQLAGDHRVIGGLRAEWKATYSQATRDEPENRTLRQGIVSSGAEVFGPGNTPFQFRYLNETSRSAQLDLSLPFSLWNPGDGQFKVGGLIRKKVRDFQGTIVRLREASSAYNPNASIIATSPGSLSIEQFWTPEVLSGFVSFVNGGLASNSYGSDDLIRSVYGMLDFEIIPGFRLVAGARVEDWTLILGYPFRPGALGTLRGYLPADSSYIAASTTRGDTTGAPFRANRDVLPSANLTIALGERANLRAAAFRSLSRPDPRELTPEEYFGIGGQCSVFGNPGLQRTTIDNLDGKIEFYPRPGEILAVSGYYKRFTRPTVFVTVFPSNENCQYLYTQAKQAEAYGIEFEARRRLDFLPGFLGNLSVNGNLSFINSKALLDSLTLPALVGELTAQFAGQSPVLANGGLSYDTEEGGFTASVLVNYFGDRVSQYGAFRFITGQPSEKIPDIFEAGRVQLDAKAQFRFFGGTTMSIAAKNLTDNRITYTQKSATGTVFPSFFQRNGRSVTVGISYEF